MILSVLLDTITVSAAAFVAWLFFLPEQAQVLEYVLLVFAATLIVPVLFSSIGSYYSFRAVSDLDWLVRVSAAWGLLALTLIFSLWAFKLSEDFSRVWLGSWFVLGWLMTLVWRGAAYLLLLRLRAKGYNHKRIAIVGAGRLGRALLQAIQTTVGSGFEAVVFFDDNADKWHSQYHGVPVLPAHELNDWLATHELHEIWFALPLRAELRLRELLHTLRHSTVNLRYVPNLSSLRLLNHAPREVLGFSMLDLSVSPMSEPMSRVLKSLEDKTISGLILLLISPILLLLALGVKLSSSGPVFYRQQRVGLNGELFDMLKFRSMPVDVEKEGVQWGSAGSKINTWFGAFIRKTSLDELPQFINVLKGDMSIVGPRPERPMFVEQFKDEIPGYMQKHMVKAGITGWAQIHGWRGDTCLKTRIEFDLWYIEHWSLLLDIKIIFLTIIKGFLHKNAC